MNWDGVADALSRVANNDATIGGLGISRLWVVGGGSVRSLADAQDIGPFLDFLGIVVVVERGIGSTMPQHHLGTRASVTWVCCADKISPCLSSHADLAIGAR